MTTKRAVLGRTETAICSDCGKTFVYKRIGTRARVFCDSCRNERQQRGHQFHLRTRRCQQQAVRVYDEAGCKAHCQFYHEGRRPGKWSFEECCRGQSCMPVSLEGESCQPY